MVFAYPGGVGFHSGEKSPTRLVSVSANPRVNFPDSLVPSKRAPYNKVLTLLDDQSGAAWEFFRLQYRRNIIENLSGEAKQITVLTVCRYTLPLAGLGIGSN
jgi:hypothetical protein